MWSVRVLKVPINKELFLVLETHKAHKPIGKFISTYNPLTS